MRLKHQAKQKKPLSVSMTPLIDVVFLLLIFFLMTMNFEKPEQVIENRLPQLGSSESEDPTKDWETVRLQIKMAKSDGALKLYLQERVIDNYSELGGFLDELPNDILIIIDAANDVPYKHVIGVYNACLKLNKKDIVFSIAS